MLLLIILIHKLWCWYFFICSLYSNNLEVINEAASNNTLSDFLLPTTFILYGILNFFSHCLIPSYIYIFDDGSLQRMDFLPKLQSSINFKTFKLLLHSEKHNFHYIKQFLYTFFYIIYNKNKSYIFSIL